MTAADESKKKNKPIEKKIFTDAPIRLVSLGLLVVVLIVFITTNFFSMLLTDTATPEEEYPNPLEFMSLSHNASLTWGSYRPGLYFGLRSRTLPTHISTGMLWTVRKASQLHQRTEFRHECRQEDGLKTYGWKEHNGRNYGHQVIEDALSKDTKLQLNTTFLSSSPREWSARMTTNMGQPQDDVANTVVDVFFYLDLGCEDNDPLNSCRKNLGSIQSHLPSAKSSSESIYQFTGHLKESPLFDQFRLTMRGTCAGLEPPSPVNSSPTTLFFYAHPSLNLMNIHSAMENKDAAHNSLFHSNGTLKNTIHVSSTLLLVQYRHHQCAHGTFDILFSSHTDNSLDNAIAETIDDESLIRASVDFKRHFEEVFSLSSQSLSPSMGDFNASLQDFGAFAFSNLIGGIGYFYGNSITPTGPSPSKPLYSAVPSRSFFPRGFLWDEGFHQLAIGRWSREVSRDVILHWMAQSDITGWIPREMILGADAIHRVPSEYQMQYPTHANPPSLILSIELLLRTSLPHDREDIVFFKTLRPHLHRWYLWFKKTQAGEKAGTWRWRGREKKLGSGKMHPNTLSSGLDDYPRATNPSEEEMHVDLHCWMIKFSRVLQSLLTTVLAHSDNTKLHNFMSTYRRDEIEWMKTLRSTHYHKNDGLFYDVGRTSNAGTLQDAIVVKCGDFTGKSSIQQPCDSQTMSSNRDRCCPPEYPIFYFPYADPSGKGVMITRIFVPQSKPTVTFVKHHGYLVLFPLLLQILPPESPELNGMLQLLRSELWSEFGLRSLSPKDLFYQQENAPGDAPYWRGAIWININYLALSALHHYGHTSGQHQKLCLDTYRQLRTNVIENIYREYVKTGYLWEQYSGDVSDRNHPEGTGQRCFPFSGWTALVINIMAELY